MTVEAAVRARLATDAGLEALVGGRVYQLKLPQTVTLPAVLVQLVDELPAYHLRGGVGLTGARVQTDVYAAEASGADPYAVATAVAEAVDAALSGLKGDVGTPPGRHVAGAFRISRRPLYEGESLREVRISQDFAVWSSPIAVVEG
jgi:hypothetical protein